MKTLATTAMKNRKTARTSKTTKAVVLDVGKKEGTLSELEFFVRDMEIIIERERRRKNLVTDQLNESIGSKGIVLANAKRSI